MSRFCPTCGAAATKGASYCSHCGAGLSLQQAGAASPREASADTLTYVAVGANITLLGMVLGGLIVLKDEGYSLEFIVAYMVLCAVALVVTDAILFWRMTRLNRRPEVAAAQDAAGALDTKELDAARARALPDPAPMPGVAEDATRAFEPSYRKRETGQ